MNKRQWKKTRQKRRLKKRIKGQQREKFIADFRGYFVKTDFHRYFVKRGILKK